MSRIRIVRLSVHHDILNNHKHSGNKTKGTDLIILNIFSILRQNFNYIHNMTTLETILIPDCHITFGMN